MSKKVPLDLVKVVMQRNQIDVRQVAQVIEDISSELAAQVDEEKTPPIKKQYVILVCDPKGQLGDTELIGWVVQIPEDARLLSAHDRLMLAAHNFNASPKGRRLPVKSLAEVCEHVPAHLLKEQQIWVKTKEPVYVVPVPNKLA